VDRRKFFRIGAAGAMALPQFPARLLAAQDVENVHKRVVNPLGRAPALLLRKLSTPIAGFPTIEPIFGGIFSPGATQTQLISANGFLSRRFDRRNRATASTFVASQAS